MNDKGKPFGPKHYIAPLSRYAMLTVGLIREGKSPPDNRVALTPSQCRWLNKQSPDIRIVAQHSDHRCFRDEEYIQAGVEVREDMADCDILLGIKEVPVQMLLPGKTYLFFSHTKKKQPHNRKLFQAIIQNEITLIDYECLEHEDGQRILGFGFFAGVVGAHNGMMAYGKRTGLFTLDRVYEQQDFRKLMHAYFGVRLPNVKIAVTGSGRVAHGILEIMNLMGIHEVEPDEYLVRRFAYPVYTQLKGADLYRSKLTGKYNREELHSRPGNFECLFRPYASQTDILMNGVYWEPGYPRLFERPDTIETDFILQTIADITDDTNGSVPVNLGDQDIADPVYGVDRNSFQKTAAYLPTSIDVMAVGNLPNELPRDASRYFGEQLIKYVLDNLLKGGSAIIDNATMVRNGRLCPSFSYLADYANPDAV